MNNLNSNANNMKNLANMNSMNSMNNMGMNHMSNMDSLNAMNAMNSMNNLNNNMNMNNMTALNFQPNMAMMGLPGGVQISQKMHPGLQQTGQPSSMPPHSQALRQSQPTQQQLQQANINRMQPSLSQAQAQANAAAQAQAQAQVQHMFLKEDTEAHTRQIEWQKNLSAEERRAVVGEIRIALATVNFNATEDELVKGSFEIESQRIFGAARSKQHYFVLKDTVINHLGQQRQNMLNQNQIQLQNQFMQQQLQHQQQLQQQQQPGFNNNPQLARSIQTTPMPGNQIQAPSMQNQLSQPPRNSQQSTPLQNQSQSQPQTHPSSQNAQQQSQQMQNQSSQSQQPQQKSAAQQQSQSQSQQEQNSDSQVVQPQSGLPTTLNQNQVYNRIKQRALELFNNATEEDRQKVKMRGLEPSLDYYTGVAKAEFTSGQGRMRNLQTPNMQQRPQVAPNPEAMHAFLNQSPNANMNINFQTTPMNNNRFSVQNMQSFQNGSLAALQNQQVNPQHLQQRNAQTQAHLNNANKNQQQPQQPQFGILGQPQQPHQGQPLQQAIDLQQRPVPSNMQPGVSVQQPLPMAQQQFMQRQMTQQQMAHQLQLRREQINNIVPEMPLAEKEQLLRMNVAEYRTQLGRVVEHRRQNKQNAAGINTTLGPSQPMLSTASNSQMQPVMNQGMHLLQNLQGMSNELVRNQQMQQQPSNLPIIQLNPQHDQEEFSPGLVKKSYPNMRFPPTVKTWGQLKAWAGLQAPKGFLDSIISLHTQWITYRHNQHQHQMQQQRIKLQMQDQYNMRQLQNSGNPQLQPLQHFTGMPGPSGQSPMTAPFMPVQSPVSELQLEGFTKMITPQQIVAAREKKEFQSMSEPEIRGILGLQLLQTHHMQQNPHLYQQRGISTQPQLSHHMQPQGLQAQVIPQQPQFQAKQPLQQQRPQVPQPQETNMKKRPSSDAFPEESHTNPQPTPNAAFTSTPQVVRDASKEGLAAMMTSVQATVISYRNKPPPPLTDTEAETYRALLNGIDGNRLKIFAREWIKETKNYECFTQLMLDITIIIAQLSPFNSKTAEKLHGYKIINQDLLQSAVIRVRNLVNEASNTMPHVMAAVEKTLNAAKLHAANIQNVQDAANAQNAANIQNAQNTQNMATAALTTNASATATPAATATAMARQGTHDKPNSKAATQSPASTGRGKADKAPPAPTVGPGQYPGIFPSGVLSPTGTPKYFEGAKDIKLQPPTKRVKRTGANATKNSGTVGSNVVVTTPNSGGIEFSPSSALSVASPALMTAPGSSSGQTGSPTTAAATAAAKTKRPTSATSSASQEPKGEAPRQSFMCDDTSCLRHSLGFDTEEELSEHKTLEHFTLADDMFKYTADIFAQQLAKAASDTNELDGMDSFADIFEYSAFAQSDALFNSLGSPTSSVVTPPHSAKSSGKDSEANELLESVEKDASNKEKSEEEIDSADKVAALLESQLQAEALRDDLIRPGFAEMDGEDGIMANDWGLNVEDFLHFKRIPGINFDSSVVDFGTDSSSLFA